MPQTPIDPHDPRPSPVTPETPVPTPHPATPATPAPPRLPDRSDPNRPQPPETEQEADLIRRRQERERQHPSNASTPEEVPSAAEVRDSANRLAGRPRQTRPHPEVAPMTAEERALDQAGVPKGSKGVV